MAMRVTGMNSGLDTESIIRQLVEVRRGKVDEVKDEQTLLGWKQEAWKDINDKLYKLFSGTLNNLKYQSSFIKKATTVSKPDAVTVITDDSAMDSVQSLKISNLAKAGYLTGGVLAGNDGKKLSSGSKVVDSLGITAGSKFEISTNGKKTEIAIDADTTLSSLVSQLKSAGVNANFDAGQQRLYIGAAKTGSQYDFSFTAANPDGIDALDKLGILTYDDSTQAAYQTYADMDATAKANAISAKVEELLKKYSAERTKLLDSNKNIQEIQEKMVPDFKMAYGEDTDITDDSARDARKTVINDRIAELQAKEADETLTTEEKAEQNKLKGELSFIEGYDKLSSDMADNDAKLAALTYDADSNPDGYLVVDADENVTAGAKLTQMATRNIEDKIATATAVLSDYEGKTGSEGAHKQKAEDAEIVLNGATYTSSENTIKVNGLTITCNAETAADEEITLTTRNDTSGIYDMIKSFIVEYGKVINEMDKLYNAPSSKGFDPLSDEEKESMSESEIEKWETKIKDSLLRRDSTLNDTASVMKEVMASGFMVNGKKMYLYDFGIETLGYFNAPDNEKNAYHIHGDADDTEVKNETNDLLAMINSDPDSVVSFFTQLSQSLYEKLNQKMGTTENSSINKIYDDKKMKLDYEEYKIKIKEAEDKLADYEDKWYKKFSAMETALAKMQSNASAVTGLLGGM